MGRLDIEVKVREEGRRVLVYVKDVPATAIACFDFFAVSKRTPLRLTGLEVRAADSGGEIQITDLRRNLALGRWAAEARRAAAEALREKPSRAASESRRAPRHRVGSPPPYETTATRYRELTKTGVRNPAAILASELGVPVTSVWNWLRRCRELGLLEPAPGPGRAGELHLKTPAPSEKVQLRPRDRGGRG